MQVTEKCRCLVRHCEGLHVCGREGLAAIVVLAVASRATGFQSRDSFGFWRGVGCQTHVGKILPWPAHKTKPSVGRSARLTHRIEGSKAHLTEGITSRVGRTVPRRAVKKKAGRLPLDGPPITFLLTPILPLSGRKLTVG